MTAPASATHLLAHLQDLGAPELRRLLVEHLTRRKLGLTWRPTPSTATARWLMATAP